MALEVSLPFAKTAPLNSHCQSIKTSENPDPSALLPTLLNAFRSTYYDIRLHLIAQPVLV